MPQVPASVDKNSRLQDVNEMAFLFIFSNKYFFIQLILLFCQDSPERKGNSEKDSRDLTSMIFLFIVNNLVGS